MAIKQAGDKTELVNDIPLSAACDPPVSQRQAYKDLQKDALTSLTRFLDLVMEQEKKYEYRLGIKSNFYQRHLMVKHFLAIQKRMPDNDRRNLAEIVASTFDRGKTTGQTII